MKISEKRKTVGVRDITGVKPLKRLHSSKTESNHMVVPQWLKILYNTVFFKSCIAHPETKKNDLDHFCIDCRQPMCPNCLSMHTFHKHVKIRRYVYNDVINRRDLCKLFDCSGIQTYHTNNAKVVFLKQRHQHQRQQQQNSFKPTEYMCIVCQRSLQDNSQYCSVACKVIVICGNECHSPSERGRCEGSSEEEGENRYLEDSNKQKSRRRRKGVPRRAPLL